MSVRPAATLTLVIALASCGGETGSDSAEQATQPVLRPLPANETVIGKVYDTAYSVPDGFYVDARADTPRSYTLYHVKDVSVSYELCSDDFDEAYEWESADNASRSVSGHYVGSAETADYFEFIRELSYADDVGNVEGLTSPGFARVFKCSRIDRNGVDRNLRDGYAGRLNLRPLTADSVREFVEYMWQFTFFASMEKKVLQSFSTERDGTIDHTLVLALAYSQGYGQCDRIDVVDWTWRADKTSGEVRKSYDLLYSLNAQIVDGVPTEC